MLSPSPTPGAHSNRWVNAPPTTMMLMGNLEMWEPSKGFKLLNFYADIENERREPTLLFWFRFWEETLTIVRAFKRFQTFEFLCRYRKRKKKDSLRYCFDFDSGRKLLLWYTKAEVLEIKNSVSLTGKIFLGDSFPQSNFF